MDLLVTDSAHSVVIARLDRAIQYSEAWMMEHRQFYVYILASEIGGTLYIGVTNDLVRRIAEHQQQIHDGFTKKYEVNRLVYFECFDDVQAAIHREKRLKKWKRQWKVTLIETDNPHWADLYPSIASG